MSDTIFGVKIEIRHFLGILIHCASIVKGFAKKYFGTKVQKHGRKKIALSTPLAFLKRLKMANCLKKSSV